MGSPHILMEPSGTDLRMRSYLPFGQAQASAGAPQRGGMTRTKTMAAKPRRVWKRLGIVHWTARLKKHKADMEESRSVVSELSDYVCGGDLSRCACEVNVRCFQASALHIRDSCRHCHYCNASKRQSRAIVKTHVVGSHHSKAGLEGRTRWQTHNHERSTEEWQQSGCHCPQRQDTPGRELRQVSCLCKISHYVAAADRTVLEIFGEIDLCIYVYIYILIYLCMYIYILVSTSLSFIDPCRKKF